MSVTHNAILHAEAELELEVGSLDEYGGDGGAAHDAQFHLHLVLQTLQQDHTCTAKPSKFRVQVKHRLLYFAVNNEAVKQNESGVTLLVAF